MKILCFLFFKNSMSAIHIIAGHIAIKHLTVILLFLLNVSQSVSHHRALKLEDARVINSRNVLFHRERVLAEIGIVLLLCLADIGWLALHLALYGRWHLGWHCDLGALKHLIYGIKMLLLVGFQLGEKIFQLLIVRRLGVLSVLFNAELLLGFQVI